MTKHSLLAPQQYPFDPRNLHHRLLGEIPSFSLRKNFEEFHEELGAVIEHSAFLHS